MRIFQHRVYSSCLIETHLLILCGTRVGSLASRPFCGEAARFEVRIIVIVALTRTIVEGVASVSVVASHD